MNQLLRLHGIGWVIVCVLAISCSDSGTSLPESDTDGKEDSTVAPNPLTYKQVDGVIKGLTKLLKDASGQGTLAQAVQNALTYLKGQSIVDRVDVKPKPEDKSPTALVVRFTNGMHYLLTIREGAKQTTRSNEVMVLKDANEAPGIVEGNWSTRRDALSDEEVDDLSDSMATNVLNGKVAVVDLDPKLPKFGEKIVGLLKKYGYQDGEITYGGPGSLSVGHVDFWKTLHEYGLVVISGHGEYVSSFGVNTFGFITNEARSPEMDEAYWNRGDLLDNRVMLANDLIATSVVDKTELEVRDDVYYFVTSRFLNHYLKSFNKDSVVIANTCKSAFAAEGVGSMPGTSLPATLLDKKASLVYGWDYDISPSIAAKTMDYWFDRILGDNKVAPQSPAYAPQSIHVAYQDALEKGHGKDPRFNSELVFFQPNMYSDYLLRPSLTSVGFINKILNTVSLSGEFGARGGEVCIAGRCQAIEPGDSWSDGSITANITPGESGYVEVRVNGRASNKMIINEWLPIVHYKTNRSKCNVEGAFFSRFRGGLNPIKTALYSSTITYGAIQQPTEDDSTFTYKVSGEWTEQNYKYECKGEGTTTGQQLSPSYLRVYLGTQLPIPSEFSLAATYTQIIERTDLLTGEVMTTTQTLSPFSDGGVMLNSKLTMDSSGVTQEGKGSTADAEWSWDATVPRYEISSRNN